VTRAHAPRQVTATTPVYDNSNYYYIPYLFDAAYDSIDDHTHCPGPPAAVARPPRSPAVWEEHRVCVAVCVRARGARGGSQRRCPTRADWLAAQKVPTTITFEFDQAVELTRVRLAPRVRTDSEAPDYQVSVKAAGGGGLRAVTPVVHNPGAAAGQFFEYPINDVAVRDPPGAVTRPSRSPP
jgi:hypothetical protein